MSYVYCFCFGSNRRKLVFGGCTGYGGYNVDCGSCDGYCAAAVVFTILLGAGFLKDFNNAFRLGLWKGRGGESVNELKRAIEAVCLVRKILVAAGAFLLFFELTQILVTMDLSASIGYMLSTGFRAPACASAVILMLLPMESTLKMKLWNLQEDRKLQVESENQESTDAQKE